MRISDDIFRLFCQFSIKTLISVCDLMNRLDARIRMSTKIIDFNLKIAKFLSKNIHFIYAFYLFAIKK